MGPNWKQLELRLVELPSFLECPPEHQAFSPTANSLSYSFAEHRELL